MITFNHFAPPKTYYNNDNKGSLRTRLVRIKCLGLTTRMGAYRDLEFLEMDLGTSTISHPNRKVGKSVLKDCK